MIKYILMAITLLMSSATFAGSNDWLLGDWQMTYDPDGDTKDIVSFSEGSQFVTTEISSGKKIKGMYFVRSGHVSISLINQGKIFMKLKLKYDNAKKKLYYNPDNTSDPAYYTKVR